MRHERLDGSSTEFIRQTSEKILRNSTGLLRINNEVLFQSLLPRLQDFQNKSGESSIKRKELSLGQEIGLNLFFNVINFCYMDPETRKEYRYRSPEVGEVKRSTGLKLAMKESGIRWNHLHTVSLLDPVDFARLAQIRTSNPLYLGMERGTRLSGFAKFLMTQGFLDTHDLLQATQYKAGRALELLSKSGYFTDTFLKRAQLAVSNLNTTLVNWDAGSIGEMESLTCMADYRIPQVFYNTSALEISKELKDSLENYYLIPAGSVQESVLRASVIVIGEMLSKKMGIIEAEVDSLLWGLSQKMSKDGELSIPHMLVATDKY